MIHFREFWRSVAEPSFLLAPGKQHAKMCWERILLKGEAESLIYTSSPPSRRNIGFTM
jgi:hypothetical protein